MRKSSRQNNKLRDIEIQTNILENAEGSCLIKCGNTHVICTATVENKAPPFLKGTGKGWITAEYGMLPRSTESRIKREAAHGRQSGRTQEIQRLIGRSLRAAVDLSILGERQIIIDCDVIKADGGTRTASITGGYVALYMAIRKLMNTKILNRNPILVEVAAISCGIVNNQVVLDLDYIEDSSAEADANFIMTRNGKIIEVQATAEEYPFSEEQFSKMLFLAKDAIKEITSIQRSALGIKD